MIPGTGCRADLESWTEPPTDKPEHVKVADSSSGDCRRRSGKSVGGGGERQQQNNLAASVKTKGASKSYDDEGEGGSRRGVAKRPAVGADTLGPKQKKDLPDLGVEVERNRAERKNDRRGERGLVLSDEDIGRLSASVASTLKPIVEEKIREAVKGMITETVKSLNVAQSLWQKDGQKRIKDMLSQHKKDLMECIKNVDTEVQQMVTTGSEGMQQKATYLVQRIQTAVADICENSSVKVGQQVGQQVENALTSHGASVKEAILEMSQKEAEVQRHLTNIFSELSEIQRKINNDLPAVHWQLQQAGSTSEAVATSEVMMVSGGVPDNTGAEMEVQVSVPAEDGSVAAAVNNAVMAAVDDAVMAAVGVPAAAAVNNAVMAAVDDAVMAAVGVPAAAGDEELNTPPEERDDGLDAGVFQDVGSPSTDVDPRLLDQPCESW